MSRSSFDDLVTRARYGDADAGHQVEGLCVRIARCALEEGFVPSPLCRAIRAEAQRLVEERGLDLAEDRNELIGRLAPRLADSLVSGLRFGREKGNLLKDTISPCQSKSVTAPW